MNRRVSASRRWCTSAVPLGKTFHSECDEPRSIARAKTVAGVRSNYSISKLPDYSIPHESHVCHAGMVRYVHHFADELEINLRITFQECYLLDSAQVDFLQLRFKILPGNIFVIDCQNGTLTCTGVLELNHNGFLGWRSGLLVGRHGNFRRLSLRRVRKHHEDNQQHQQYINQRSNVDLGRGYSSASQRDCHVPSPYFGL